MPDQHATLSPSKAERWSNCPGSVALCATLPKPPSSSYAEEGTAAHELAELTARRVILGEFGSTRTRAWRSAVDAWGTKYGIERGAPMEKEMTEAADGYVGLLTERMALHPGSVLLLEQRVETGVPSCWGTSDAVIVSPDAVEVVDLKYGVGVQVEAAGNAQLRLYAVGALEGFGDLLGDVEDVTYTIYQPRRDHVSSETVKADDLRAWRDSLLPVAEEALAGSDRFGPSEKTCKFCPASGRCPAQLEYVTRQEFSEDPSALSPEETAAALELLPVVEEWVKGLRSAAFDQIYREGVEIPGWKVVMGGQRRTVTDESRATTRLSGAGYDPDAFTTRKFIGVTALDKLVGGKDTLSEILGDALGTTTGSPSLVRQDDRRAGVTSAAQDFAD